MKGIQNVLVVTLLGVLVVGCAGPRTELHSTYAYSPENTFDIRIENSDVVPEQSLSVFKTQLGVQTEDLKTDNEQPMRVVTIEFTDYRSRHAGVIHDRELLGGGDAITSITTIKDAQLGEVLGRVEHTSNNPHSRSGLISTLRFHADQFSHYVLTGEIR